MKEVKQTKDTDSDSTDLFDDSKKQVTVTITLIEHLENKGNDLTIT